MSLDHVEIGIVIVIGIEIGIRISGLIMIVT